MGVKIIAKDRVWWMRLLGKLLTKINPGFMNMYTTIGNTVYMPAGQITPPVCIMRHELVHVRQQATLTFPVFAFLYLLVPLPFGLAYFRWRFEREAYMEDIKARYATVDEIVGWLGSGMYGWCWPKKWMRAWFKKELSR